MNTAKERLVARVGAVNRAHTYANELYNKLTPIFTQLVGQKIFKADGTLLEKVKKLLPELPRTVPLDVWKHTSDYSLAFTIKTCESMPPDSCMYYEVTVYIGEMKDGVLQSIGKAPNFSTYSVEDVEHKREVYKAAKTAADNALSALYPFGEYDR